MPERIVWHVGLPKTGTSYLQQVIWGNRDLLAERGVSLPGFGHRAQLWAALDLAEEPGLASRDPRAPGAWQRMVDQIGAFEGTALLTHEFFASATAEQAARGREAFGETEVHLVVTARDASSMLRAGWQEFVKNGGERSLAEIAEREEPHQFSWWSWDLGNVLERWAPVVRPEHVHVLPMPPSGSDPAQHWINFAQVLGVDPDVVLPEDRVNASLDVVQIETLRHVNQYLEQFRSPRDRGHWIRGHLAETHLTEQDSERLMLGADLREQCQQRTDRALALIESRGYRVVGDPAGLHTPASAGRGRTVESVTVEEVADSAARLVADLLHDVRSSQEEVRDLERRVAELEAVPEPAPGGVLRQVNRLFGR